MRSQRRMNVRLSLKRSAQWCPDKVQEGRQEIRPTRVRSPARPSFVARARGEIEVSRRRERRQFYLASASLNLKHARSSSSARISSPLFKPSHTTCIRLMAVNAPGPHGPSSEPGPSRIHPQPIPERRTTYDADELELDDIKRYESVSGH